MKVELRVNGTARQADVEPRATLLDTLREAFALTGTHAGCEHGVCGACTVLLDGAPVRSCLIFACQADGYAITTIEGLVALDPDLGKPEIRRYVIGHDCGTVINPHIVRGMTLGGIAHGIGAALLEEFVYDEEGQLLTQSFMDYLLPSSHEVPPIEIVHHCTPSPFTVFGQKGSGESGYLGAPAAISGALNDAVEPLGIVFDKLPIRMSAISDAVAAARAKHPQEKEQA